jgi:hypothetical protein
MALGTFDFHTDAALTTVFVPPMNPAFNSNGSTPDLDFSLYLGSTDVTQKLVDNASPGVAQITMAITDASPGSGPETSHVKLANSSANLSTAIAGASLNIGTEILGGVPGAVRIFFRFTDPGAANTGTDISIGTASQVKEIPV